MDSATDTENNKLDPSKLIIQGLTYLRHLRLMLLMLALGVLAGIVYFLFATPLYQAKSLVYFQPFGSGLQNKEVPETLLTSVPRFSRGMIDRFSSQQIQIGAAKRLGLISESGTYEDVMDHVSKVHVSLLDPRHLEVSVMAKEPEVVRKFSEAMVEEFQGFQEESWQEFRTKAIELYESQLDEIDKQVSETVKSLSEVEREQRVTEVSIEQRSLLEIPKMLVQAREKLVRMDLIRQSLDRLEAERPSSATGISASEKVDAVLAKLSLLSNFEKDTLVEVGDVVRKPTGGADGAVKTRPTVTPQIVQPSDIEGVESWRELEKERRLLANEVKKASETYLPEHPEMIRLKEKLDSTDEALLAEFAVLNERFHLEYERLQERIGEFEARLPEYYEVTEQLGQSAVAYDTVEQSQKMWSKARENLADKLAAISFSDEYDFVQMRFKGHIRLRDESPVSPNKKKLAMMAILVGLAGAVGVPTILNLLNVTSSNLQQLEEYTGVRGIGIIPLTDPAELESVHRSPAQGATVPNYLLECFRLVRAGITLHPGPDGESQVVLVTSARPKEGKTTQSANLAWAFHSMGESVLLVDCDLRRGRLHNLLGIDSAPGMTKMLLGRDQSPRGDSQNRAGRIRRSPTRPGHSGHHRVALPKAIRGTVELLAKTLRPNRSRLSTDPWIERVQFTATARRWSRVGGPLGGDPDERCERYRQSPAKNRCVFLWRRPEWSRPFEGGKLLPLLLLLCALLRTVGWGTGRSAAEAKSEGGQEKSGRIKIYFVPRRGVSE